MKKIILSAALMLLTSTAAFAEIGGLSLTCTNTNTTVKNQLAIISNVDGSEILVSSMAPNSRRGKNFPLTVASARRNILILENAKIGIKVVVNTTTPAAEIYDQQGLVATCE
jgi:hypothetical protein